MADPQTIAQRRRSSVARRRSHRRARTGRALRTRPATASAGSTHSAPRRRARRALAAGSMSETSKLGAGRRARRSASAAPTCPSPITQTRRRRGPGTPKRPLAAGSHRGLDAAGGERGSGRRSRPARGAARPRGEVRSAIDGHVLGARCRRPRRSRSGPQAPRPASPKSSSSCAAVGPPRGSPRRADHALAAAQLEPGGRCLVGHRLGQAQGVARRRRRASRSATGARRRAPGPAPSSAPRRRSCAPAALVPCRRTAELLVGALGDSIGPRRSHALELAQLRPRRQEPRRLRSVKGAVVQRHAEVGHRPDRDRVAASGPSITTGRFTIASRSRIATCGWLMIGVASTAPNWPGLVIVKVPPLHVVGLSAPARARSATVGDRRRHALEAEALGLLDHRHDQPVFERHRDARG